MMPEENYLKLAMCVESDPEDAVETAQDSSFRTTMATAYMMGRESAFAESNKTLEEIMTRIDEFQKLLVRMTAGRD